MAGMKYRDLLKVLQQLTPYQLGMHVVIRDKDGDFNPAGFAFIDPESELFPENGSLDKDCPVIVEKKKYVWCKDLAISVTKCTKEHCVSCGRHFGNEHGFFSCEECRNIEKILGE